MLENFEKGLNQHFEKIDQALREKAKHEKAIADERSALHAKFMQIAKEVIEPRMAKIRDLLLSRNWPAGIYWKEERDLPTSQIKSIALHSSREIEHMSLIARDPMNIIAYSLNQDSTVVFKATLLDKTETLALEQIIPEKVEDQLLRAVQSMRH